MALVIWTNEPYVADQLLTAKGQSLADRTSGGDTRNRKQGVGSFGGNMFDMKNK